MNLYVAAGTINVDAQATANASGEAATVYGWVNITTALLALSGALNSH